MKTLYSTALIAVLALGFLMAATPGKAEAWYGGPAVSFSVVVPPFGVSVGAPAPYYYAPGYAAPTYPVYGSPYYGPYYRPYYGYYGYGPYYRHGYWGHGGHWGGHGHVRRH